jgi:hypothetical protein
MEIDPLLPQAIQTAAAQAELQKIKRSRGRPAGAKNYSGVSLIARSMKEKGIYWVYELIDAYKLYQRQLELYVKDPTRSQPDARLLEFWMTILPYITVKMIDRETRRERPKKEKKRISHSAIQALAQAEGREI